MKLDEFSNTPSNGNNDYLHALASAWYYNGYSTGSLQKGIKTKEDIEKILSSGVICPDGKTRKFTIDYNSDFDGVILYSDDYYEYSDYDKNGNEIDSRTLQRWGPYEHIEYKDRDLDEDKITEDDPYVLDEVAMNPKTFAKAIEEGSGKGVLVGFEFEVCIPKQSIELWKTGDVESDIPRFNVDDDSWLNGKTVKDLLLGIKEKANNQYSHVFEDLFKLKVSVSKLNSNIKSPFRLYNNYVHKKMKDYRDSLDVKKAIFQELYDFIHDPETKNIEVRTNNSVLLNKYPNLQEMNGYTFTLQELKDATGLDFRKKIPKKLQTLELAEKIKKLCEGLYRATYHPYDTQINKIANVENTVVNRYQVNYDPEQIYRFSNPTDQERELANNNFVTNFTEFCKEKFGTDELKDLMKKYWAYKGRVNNSTPVLKEKLWYYVTPNAPIPSVLRPRGRGRTDYISGAEFLKAKLQDNFGSDMTIFTNYHQATKKLDRWYIEPDGSLRPNLGDNSAEIVSPPLPANKAMSDLKTFYTKAKELKLYTNDSTGIHINVSIPDTLDVLKLATFVGDVYVLAKFNREKSTYARSVLKSLKGAGDLPIVGSKEFKDAESEMRDLVKDISRNHFASVNFNGKYVSFRHAGGNYLDNMQDIVETVGRFVRAMIIASDPNVYREEYITKLTKLMKSNDENLVRISDVRTIASKGIPTMNIDAVIMPTNNQDTIDDSNIRIGIDSLKARASNYDGKIDIENDPFIREKLLNDEGFANATKNWIRSAPDSAFYHVTIYPDTKQNLDDEVTTYSLYGDKRGSAIGIRKNGAKYAVGIEYRRLIKPDSKEYSKALQILRGQMSKPVPLPDRRQLQKTKTDTTQNIQQTIQPQTDMSNTDSQVLGRYSIKDINGNILDTVNGEYSDAIRAAEDIANQQRINVFVYDWRGNVLAVEPENSNQSLSESVNSKQDLEKVKHFIKWSIDKLNIQKPYPKITLSKDTEKAKKGHHTGVHTEDNRIWVYVANRNLIDIFRTIFHELVHEKQSQLNMIKPGDSYPGSPIEAMADMVAGKYIKIYGKEHPEIFQ